VFCSLATDLARTNAIADEVKALHRQSRKILVLTERTEHLDAIAAALAGNVSSPFVLHGRMSKKQRAKLIEELDALPPDAPHVLLATGKLVGEGFVIIQRWTLWFWPRQYPGRVPCNSTQADSTVSTPPKRMFGSSTSLIPAIRRWFACGTSASVVIGQWGIVLDRLPAILQLSPK
jgi:hypothetical protein